jgi:hypothetical protein
VIDDVNTCCGVTLPFDYPKKIRSRSASFVVLRMRLPFTYNQWNQTLLLKTNDRHNPTTKIHIRAQPDLAMKIVPPAVNMGYIIADKHFADVAKIRTTTETKLSRYITASSPYLKPSLREVTSSRNYMVDIEVLKTAPRGKLEEYLYATTDTPQRRTIIIPIFATIERGLRLRPEQVFFGVVKGKTEVSSGVLLEVIEPGWETVKVVPPSCDAVKAEIEQKGKKKFELRVSLDPVKMPEILKSHIMIESASSDVIQIPLLAMRKNTLPDT